MTEVARTAIQAWQQLKQKGGIEPEGRDRDFVRALIGALDPAATTIEQALISVDIDRFVSAMFDTIGPFAAIYTEILTFFRRAGATRSKEAWTLALGDAPFDFDHFAQFIETTQTVLGVRELVLLSPDAAWDFRQALGKQPREGTPPDFSPDVDDWRRQWAEGVYAAYPASIAPERVPVDLRAAAAIANAALQTLRVSAPTRAEAKRIAREAFAIVTPPLGGLDAPTIAGLEQDYWLKSVIESLDYATKATGKEKTDIVDAITKLLTDLPRARVQIALSQLEKLIALPAWKMRHELYAVWIATLIVDALPEHALDIHAMDGVLSFAFKKTLLATIDALEGQTFLYSERQAILKNPRGKGRKHHVQPDYSVWRPDECCLLVIEVKHYKKANKRKFSEVLADYADAHPGAQVVLVNYAGTADILDTMTGVSAAARDRCRHIADLTPYGLEAKTAFQKMVRDAVGAPALAAPAPKLLIDVSGSMRPAFSGGRDSVMASWLRSDEVDPACEVVFVDIEETWRGSVEQAIDRLRHFGGGGATSLCASAIRLLGQADRLLVATDEDGLADLKADARLYVEPIGFRTNLWAAWATLAG